MLSKIKKYGTIKHMITKNGLSNMCEIIQNINEVTSVKVAETYTHTHTHTHTHTLFHLLHSYICMNLCNDLDLLVIY